MKNKKLKFALHELEQEMEVISNEKLACYKGGEGSGDYSSTGGSGYYSYDSFLELLSSGLWHGGYIEGFGYFEEPPLHLDEQGSGNNSFWFKAYSDLGSGNIGGTHNGGMPNAYDGNDNSVEMPNAYDGNDNSVEMPNAYRNNYISV